MSHLITCIFILIMSFLSLPGHIDMCIARGHGYVSRLKRERVKESQVWIREYVSCSWETRGYVSCFWETRGYVSDHLFPSLPHRGYLGGSLSGHMFLSWTRASSRTRVLLVDTWAPVETCISVDSDVMHTRV